MKTEVIRRVVPVVVFVGVAAAWVGSATFGTLSAFGIGDMVMLCPLGALATMLAAKTLIPRAVIALAIAIVLIALFGRAFCGWVCPVPLVARLRDFFGSGKKRVRKGGSSDALPDDGGGCAGCSSHACPSKRGSGADTRHIVLASALLSTFLFGFPVFCLVCPIGLAFASVFLVINLFTAGDVSWMVLAAPVLLIAEVVLFRSWCSSLCPLGAFMSLVGKANRTFVPRIDDELCLESSKGTSCGVCASVCPEGIDVRHPDLSSAAMNECTKCRACVEACPAHAIRMPLLAEKPKGDERAGAIGDEQSLS